MTKEDALRLMPELIEALTEEELQRFTDDMVIRAYKKHEIIYNEGEIPSQLFCLLSGKVKVYKDGVGGRCQIVRVMNAFEPFGYRASFSGEPFITAAAAFEPSVIACVPLDVVRDLITKNAAFAWYFIHQLASVLGMSDARTVNLTQKHIRGRLADSILFMRDSYGLEDDGQTLNISLSREDLANLSNMTTSNAIRTLSLFAHEGLIEAKGRKIKILDVSALSEISERG